MTRRKYSLGFKIEAVKLVTERGVSVAQAARDLDLVDLGFASMSERVIRRGLLREGVRA